MRLMVSSLDIIDDAAQSLPQLLDPVLAHGIRGKRVHDANIVATMLENRIPALLTNNLADFALFHDIMQVIPLSAATEALP